MAKRRQPECNLPDAKECREGGNAQMEVGTIGQRQKEQRRREKQKRNK